MKLFAKIILVAFLLNSAALMASDFENVKELFVSTVDFSMTIAPAGAEFAKPIHTSPADNSNVFLPVNFAAAPFPAPFTKVQFFIRSKDGNYETPFFMMEADTSPPQHFSAEPLPPFQINETYFWKIRYLLANNQWTEFSDETKFMVMASPPAATGGGGVAYSGGGVTPSVSSGGGVPLPAMAPSAAPPISAPASKPAAKKSSSPPKQSSSAKKPAQEKVKEPPVTIKFTKKKIRKGKPLPIRIMPAKEKPAATKKTIPKKINFRLKRKNGKISDQKKSTIDISGTQKKKTLPLPKNLSEGSYIAEASYESDGTVFAFATEFDVVPSPPIFFTLFRWNEGGLALLLAGIALITAVRKFRGKHAVRRGRK